MTDKNFDENVAVVDSVADNTADSSKSSADENLNGAENSPVVLEHVENSVADNVDSENLSAADENLDHADKSSDLIDDSDDDDAYSSECAITTVDNPFDPLEDFDNWFSFDEQKGYHTCSYLGRIVRLSDEMSDQEVAKETERAIDEILAHDIFRIYKKVKRRVPDSDSPDSSTLSQSDVDESSEQFQKLEPESGTRSGEISTETPEGA